MIKHVRLDINYFVRPNEWEFDLENSKLTSLKSLRNLDLFIYTHKHYVTLPSLLSSQNPCLVNSVLEFSARRPSFATVSVRHKHIYYTSDPKELEKSSRAEKCLERIQEIFTDKAYTNEEQRTTNDDRVNVHS